MVSFTKDKSQAAPYDSAAQLFDQIGEVFNSPAALKSPDTFANELQKSFGMLQAISVKELEAVQAVARALSSHIDRLIPTLPSNNENHAAILRLRNELQTREERARSVVGNPRPFQESIFNKIEALDEDAEVRSILNAARRREVPPMSTEVSVREGAGLLAEMRARSAATLATRIDGKELLSSSELQDALGIRRQSISDAVKSGRLFAMVGPSGENYYPAFYADESLDRRAVEKVSKALGSLPATSKYFFFTSKFATLGETPLEALRKGRLAEVLVAASAFAVC